MRMTDDELVALIDREASNAIGADDLTADVRTRALEFYMGEAKGELQPPDL